MATQAVDLPELLDLRRPRHPFPLFWTVSPEPE
jgi:hypothetical protein